MAIDTRRTFRLVPRIRRRAWLGLLLGAAIPAGIAYAGAKAQVPLLVVVGVLLATGALVQGLRSVWAASSSYRLDETGLTWRRWGWVRRFPFEKSVLTETPASDGGTYPVLLCETLWVLVSPAIEAADELTRLLEARLPLRELEEARREAADQALEAGQTYRTGAVARLVPVAAGLLCLALSGAGLAQGLWEGAPSGLVFGALFALLAAFCFRYAWMAAQRIVVTAEDVLERRFRVRRTIRYEEVTRADWQTELLERSLAIHTPNASIRFGKSLKGYDDLVGLVYGRVPEAAKTTPVFPYTVRAANYALYAGALVALGAAAVLGIATVTAARVGDWDDVAVCAVLGLVGPALWVLRVAFRTRRYVFNRDGVIEVRFAGNRVHAIGGPQDVGLSYVRQGSAAFDNIARFVHVRLPDTVLRLNEHYIAAAAEELLRDLRLLYPSPVPSATDRRASKEAAKPASSERPA